MIGKQVLLSIGHTCGCHCKKLAYFRRLPDGMEARRQGIFCIDGIMFSGCEIYNRFFQEVLLRQGEGNCEMYTLAIRVIAVWTAALIFRGVLAFTRFFFTKTFFWLLRFGCWFLFSTAFFGLFVIFSTGVRVVHWDQHQRERYQKQCYGKSCDH